MGALLGVEGIGGHVGAMSMVDFENEKKREYLMSFLIEALQYLSVVGKDTGLKYLLWEPMPLVREAPCTIDDAKRLHEKVNQKAAIPICFCLDLGHQCTEGVCERDSDPYEWLRQLASYSPVIHLQQTDGKADCHWPFTKEYNVRGIIDPVRVVDAIEQSGAKDVTLLFEIIHPFEADEGAVLRDLKKSVTYWIDYVKK